LIEIFFHSHLPFLFINNNKNIKGFCSMRYLLEKVSKKEIDEALKNPNVRIGVEFEFYIKVPEYTEIDDEDHFRKKFFKNILVKKYNIPTHWEYKEEPTLNSGIGVPIEIATTPMNIDVFMNVVPKMFDAIDKYGITNNECGFHVNISLSNVQNLHNTLDIVKLVLFTDEEYIYKAFDVRRNNTYARSMKDMMFVDRMDMMLEDLIDKRKLENIYHVSHTNAINHEHIKNEHYIEFRYIGGYDYHKKWNDIRRIVAHYIHNLVVACDPEYKRKEYMLKMHRIMERVFTIAKNIYRNLLIDYGKDVSNLKNIDKMPENVGFYEYQIAAKIAIKWLEDVNMIKIKPEKQRKIMIKTENKEIERNMVEFLTEKVLKRDIDSALKNQNVRIGCEFEFVLPEFDKKYGKAAQIWVEWDNYMQRLDAWESSTEEYENAGEEEGINPPDIPKWAEEIGYEPGDDIPEPYELFDDIPKLDIKKFFNIVVKEFLPLEKLPFNDYIISSDNETKSTSKWVIKPDATIGPSGIEVVSPILTIDQFLDICPKMFNFIEKYGVTTDSCGFHISISLKNVPNLSKTLDVVKMALFLDEEYIYKFFKKRRDNDYARSAHKSIKVGLTKEDIEEFIRDNIDVTKLRKAIPNTHFEAINIEHLNASPNKQYIEFRYIGSGDYHKKWNLIKKIVAHYIWALCIGSDPEFKKKEYMLKLNRLMLKFDLFTKLKRLDTLEKENKQDTPEYNFILNQVKKIVSMGINANDISKVMEENNAKV